MAESAPSGRALYLYGIVRQRDARRLLPVAPEGPAFAGPFALASGRLAAVVEAVGLDEFGEAALEKRLSEPEWVGRRARRHHEVLAALSRVGPAAPARFATVFLAEDRVRTLLDAHEEELAVFLDRVDGREEWSVHLEADPAALGQLADRTSRVLAELAAERSRARPGAGYLLGKRQRARREAEMRRLAAELATELAGEVEGLVEASCEGRSGDCAESKGVPVLQLSVLVPCDGRERFERGLSALAEARAEVGLTVSLAGPWPPYSFCPRFDGAWHTP